MELVVRNVNEAFERIVRGIHTKTIPTVAKPSRAGNVLQIEEPVILTYTHPRERVLFNEARDSNCFFTLFESLWMLAGRNDVEPLAYFSSNIASVASDDGRTFNGAYGFRWRHAGVDKESHDPRKPIDQLNLLVDYLRKHPEGRRAVLQMWNVEDDLLRVETTKDVCCNTCVFFSIREWTMPIEDQMRDVLGATSGRCLDMTVINRSNDLIWGMLGANVVHFSCLQEYLACQLGVTVGKYHQITNNLHVYESNWKPTDWLRGCYGDEYTEWKGASPSSIPLVEDPETFDREVREFVDRWQEEPFWNEPFLQCVAAPMCIAFYYHKAREYEKSLNLCSAIEAPDWKLAATRWINKRRTAWEARSHG